MVARKSVRGVLAPLLALLALLWAVPAHAEWKGEISSTSLNRLPTHPAFDVVIYDDTEENLAFRKTFLDALGRAGYQTNEDAPYFFSFATSVTWKAKRQEEIQKEKIRRYPVERGEITAPLGGAPVPADNPETRMFGDRRTTPPLIAPRISNRENDRLDISVTIRESSTNRVMWTADLALPLRNSDRERIARSIIGPIIRTIGLDVSHEPFEIR